MTTPSYDERRHRLLRTAATVFARQGFHRTTMRDLSRATGMSLAGMYHYVGGKDELLFLIQRETFRRVDAQARTALKDLADPVEQLRAFIRHHVIFFTEHMAEMQVLSHEAGGLSGEREEAIVALKRRYTDLLVEILRRLGNAPDPRIAGYAIFGMMNWIYTWYHPEGPVPARALADQFTQIALHGVAAPVTVARRAGYDQAEEDE